MPTLEELFLEKQEKNALQAIKTEVKKQEKMRAEQTRLAQLDALAKKQKAELDALIAEQQADQAQDARGIKKYGFTGDNTLKPVIFEDFQENEPYDWNGPHKVSNTTDKPYVHTQKSVVFTSTKDRLSVTPIEQELIDGEVIPMKLNKGQFINTLVKENAFQKENQQIVISENGENPLQKNSNQTEPIQSNKQGAFLTMSESQNNQNSKKSYLTFSQEKKLPISQITTPNQDNKINKQEQRKKTLPPWILKGLQENNIPFSPDNGKDGIRFISKTNKVIIKHYTETGYIIIPIRTKYDKKLGKRVFTIDTKNIIRHESKKENEPVTPNPEKSNGVLDSSIEKNLENINLQLKNISDMKDALEKMLSELK